MVLLNLRYWEPADPSLPANPNEEMWMLDSTGEIFGEYSDYLKALYLTKSRVWSSVYTGVSNLTHQEALLEDERGRALARKVRHRMHVLLPEIPPSASIFLKLPLLFLSCSFPRNWRLKLCSMSTSVHCASMI